MFRYLALILLFSLIVFSGIRQRDPDADETATVITDPGYAWENFVHGMHPPVYYSIISALSYIPGNRLLKYRVLSIFFSFLTLLVFFRIVRILHIDHIWMWIFAFTPGFLYFTREATYYSWHILTGTLIFYTWIRADKKNDFFWFLFFSLTGFYSYYYHLFLITALCLISLKKRAIFLNKFIFYFIIFSSPLVMMILKNPFIHGISSGSSAGLAATKPAVYMFDMNLARQYIAFFPAYFFLAGERYTWLSFWFALPVTVAIWSVTFLKASGRKYFPALLFPYLCLLVFSLITESRISRISFFPHHLLPFSSVFICVIALNCRRNRYLQFFPQLLLILMLFQDYDHFFNPDTPYQNRDELNVILSHADKLCPGSNDLLFAGYSYEWKLVSYSHQLNILRPDYRFCSLEEYDNLGNQIFSGKTRVFEFSLPWLESFSETGKEKYQADVLYRKLLLAKKSNEFLKQNFILSDSVYPSGVFSSYCLRIWSRTD